jgi:hypothetical protein
VVVKLILICAIVALFVAFLRSKPGVRIQAGKRVAVVVFAAVNIYAIVRPEDVSALANLIGVGRGTDLVLYALVIAFLMGMLNFYIRFKGADQRFTDLARAMALREAEVANPERLGTDRLGATTGAAPRGDADRERPCS